MIDVQSLKNIFIYWGENTTLHAIPKVFKEPKLPVKILWLGSFLFSSSLCVYVLVANLITYLQFGVTTNVNLYRVIPQDFPTVTICNSNGFLTESGFDNIQKIYNKLLRPDYVSTNASYYDLTNFKLSELDQIAKTYLYLDSNSTQRTDFSLTMDDMLVSCFFRYERCTSNDFEYFYDISLGNCYRFNSNVNADGSSSSTRKVYSAGPDSGLILELFVGSLDSSNYFSSTSGIFISVHNKTKKPVIPIEGVNLPTGHSNDLAITKTFFQKLKTPNSFCLDENEVFSRSAYDSDFFRYTFDYSDKYSQFICLKICFQKLFIDECYCYDAKFPNLNSTVPACREIGINCTRLILSTIDDSYVSTYCLPFCPLECNQMYYSYQLTGSSYPTKGYGKFLIQNSSFDFPDTEETNLKQTVLQIRLNYEAMTYEVISESLSQPFLMFLSNTGGTLGLFLGCSLLSLLEVFEPFFIMLSRNLKARKQNNIIKVQEANSEVIKTFQSQN